MARTIDFIHKTAAVEELRRGPLSRDRADGLRVRLLARAGTYGAGGGENAAAAAALTGDALEDEVFRLAVERAQRPPSVPVSVAVIEVLTALLAELAAGGRP